MAALSGAAALIHQLLWTRRLIDLLGAGHESSARVFGCFFLGLALGAALMAWLRPRVKRPWRWFASAEAMIGLLSMPAILLPYWTAWMWPALGMDALQDARGAWVKLWVSIVVVVPPALAMGTTLPILGFAVLRDRAHLQRQGIWLYAVNTFGGVLGLALAVLFLLHWLGAAGTMWAAVALNGLAMLLALFADRHDAATLQSVPTTHADERDNDAVRSVRRWACGLAFLSGFCILSFEVIALQILMLIAPLSFYAPAALLMGVILLLAFAAALTPLLTRGPRAPERLIGWALMGAGLMSVLTPPLFFLAVDLFAQGAAPSTFYEWMWNLIGLVLLSLGPALALAALIFPGVLAWSGTAGRDPEGRRWGWLLAANGVGGWLGAEGAYRWLLPWLGPHQALGVIGLLYLLAGIVWSLHSRSRKIHVTLLILLLGLALGAVHWWLPTLPLISDHNRLTLVELKSGREGTVAVVDVKEGGRSLLMSNQYVLGSTASRWAQERQAHLPLLLHPNPRRVAAIGLATGITPAGVLMHDAVEQLTVIELSPLVVDLAQSYFADYQRGLFTDPRVTIAVEDGRTFMAAAHNEYDVILGDLFLPWGPGEARLYSVEHFAAVRAALRPGGVFCQWLAMYQLTPDQFNIIAATFQEVFPVTYVVINDFGAYPSLGLVGFRDADWDWAVIDRRLHEARATGWDDALMRSLYAIRLLSMGQLKPLGHIPINTLDNMRVELDAGRLKVVADPAQTYLFGRRWIDWLDTLPLEQPGDDF